MLYIQYLPDKFGMKYNTPKWFYQQVGRKQMLSEEWDPVPGIMAQVQ